MVAQVSFEDAYFLEHLFHHVEQVFVFDTRHVDRFAGEVAPFALPTLITPPALVCHDEVGSKTRAQNCTIAGRCAALADATAFSVISERSLDSFAVRGARPTRRRPVFSGANSRFY